jgi:hypothetical protein
VIDSPVLARAWRAVEATLARDGRAARARLRQMGTHSCVRLALDTPEPSLNEFLASDGIPDLSRVQAFVRRARGAAAEALVMCADTERVGVFEVDFASLRTELAGLLERRAARLLVLVKAEVVGAISAVKAEAERTQVALRTMPESADHLDALRVAIKRVSSGLHQLRTHVEALSALCSFLEAQGCELAPKQQAIRWQAYALPAEIASWLPRANQLFRRMRAEFRESFHAEHACFNQKLRHLLDTRAPAVLDLDGIMHAAEHYDAVRAALDALEWCESAAVRIERHARLFESAHEECRPELALLQERLLPRARLWDLAAEWADADQWTLLDFARAQRGALRELVEAFLRREAEDAAFPLRAAHELQAQFDRVLTQKLEPDGDDGGDEAAKQS